MLIAGIFGFFFALSSFNTSDTGIAPGLTAPALNLENGNGQTSLAEMRGNYVVLNFWSASDPQGRMNVRIAQSQIENLGENDKIRQIAVNADDSERMFSAIVRNDNMNPDLQYYVSGKKAEQVIDNFSIDKGVRTLLINPEGKIIEINPDCGSLAEKILGDKKKR